ncbi:MAG TPA: aspartate/glutamate racemase family protein [Alphaproteobacteria bacterium]|nr:aspartate/glutamate racemase family protein [Alphaproteobacteria bacterium]
MSARILVINPNSTEAVTRGIDDALEPLRTAGGPRLDCVTLAEGPPGVETQRHVDEITLPLCRLIEREDNRSQAFVIACFSDPGVHAAREATRHPVFGIASAGIATALNLGNRIGIIAILKASLARHARAFRAMGVEGRIAGERPIGLGVVELAEESRTLARLREVGAALRDEDRADVLVLGCAGMAKYRGPLEAALGVAVVDPTQAAVGMAIAAVQLGYRTN